MNSSVIDLSWEPDHLSSRIGLSLESLRRTFHEHLYYTLARFPEKATENEFYMALAFTVRDQMLHRWIKTVEQYRRPDIRLVCYLSAEFLLGPHLENNLVNLGIFDKVREAAEPNWGGFRRILDQEEEPGLGNGGLGRLAACYLDSLATLEIPSVGYGIRYEFGIFDQEIHEGWQIEVTDKWLRRGNPWEIHRPEIVHHVHLGGRTETYRDEAGKMKVRWIPNHTVKGVAYDTPILGYRVNTCNLLRLWAAEAVESFGLHAFNTGDYYGAVEEKIHSETISKVLYPNDQSLEGKKLRLIQQYFFVSCSLQNMMWLMAGEGVDVDCFNKWFVIQLNDTHPSIAVAELMRLLIDEHGIDWDRAWEITTDTCCYTNHTLLPEALEKWPLDLFAGILPRHIEIIYEINRRFLDEVRAKYPGDEERVQRLSLIDETSPRYVRMAHLACVGSKSINGVAELHSRLLKEETLRDFFEIMPHKFNNKTNGVTPRRFVVLANPGLSELITSRIGDQWVSRMEQLRNLEVLADDKDFCEKWRTVKHANKERLASLVLERTGIEIDPSSMFDVLVKRLHEYKRQHLQVLHIIDRYNRIKRNPDVDMTPRTFIFGGKAAPGYFMAKLIIKLINSVAEVVNHDPDVRGRIKVVFFPDFNVKNAQHIYPAADLSEQISLAGKEASGTGNMKFSMNGALTIGTMDGANIEIREEVGAENFFLFGLTAGEVHTVKSSGYRARDYYESNPRLKEAVDLLGSGIFSNGDQGLFKPIVDSLLDWDEYMLLADFQSYLDVQAKIDEAYRDRDFWTRMSILNVARIGKFSSDRAIREYCDDIWEVSPMPVHLAVENDRPQVHPRQ